MIHRVGLLGCSGFIASYIQRSFSQAGIPIFGFGRNRPTGATLEGFSYCDLEAPQPLAKKTHFENLIFNSTIKGRFEKNSPQFLRQGRVTAPDFSDLFAKMNISCDRLITIGSSEEYGPRSDDTEISENGPMAPLSSYGFWKNELYQNMLHWKQSENKSGIHLRPFNVIGPGSDPQMFIGSLISRLLLDESFPMTAGEQWRSFASVQTLSTTVLKLVEAKDWGFAFPAWALNVSDPHYFSLREVAEKIQSLVRRGKIDFGSVAYREDEVWHQKPDLRMLKKFLGDNYYPDFTQELCEIIRTYQGGQSVS